MPEGKTDRLTRETGRVKSYRDPLPSSTETKKDGGSAQSSGENRHFELKQVGSRSLNNDELNALHVLLQFILTTV